MEANNKLLNWGIGVGLLFPIFFQFSGGVYSELLNDSGGNIASLPLPLAVIACFGGVILYRKRFREASIAWTFIAATLVIMLFSVLFAKAGQRIEIRKLMLLAQFLMPMSAMALGQMVCDDDQTIPKAFLTVLLVVIPLQLIAGWLQGTLTLTHNLYIFSIYQHLQFVPVIFVSAFVVTTAGLRKTHQRVLWMLFPLMIIYVLASGSFLTIAVFMTFVTMLVGGIAMTSRKIHRSLVPAVMLAVSALCMLSVGAYVNAAKDKTSIKGDLGSYLAKFQTLSEGEVPSNVSERLADWTMFGRGIIESTQTMAVGHAAPLPREVRSSAHNWYIDMAYSFGLMPLVPVLALIGYTIHLYWRRRCCLTPDIRWLAFAVFFLVIIDNNFKVTLRQPYPGIFAFFLWGMLLTRLRTALVAKLAN